jgi:hypothetical protein
MRESGFSEERGEKALDSRDLVFIFQVEKVHKEVQR